MITLRQDGILKALQGLVTMEEVLRETIEVWYNKIKAQINF
jgi:type II secretory ATPase GspE/PulE/Tfp pilus assembly ATPase PilB-like protein